MWRLPAAVCRLEKLSYTDEWAIECVWTCVNAPDCSIILLEYGCFFPVSMLLIPKSAHFSKQLKCIKLNNKVNICLFSKATLFYSGYFLPHADCFTPSSPSWVELSCMMTSPVNRGGSNDQDSMKPLDTLLCKSVSIFTYSHWLLFLKTFCWGTIRGA